MRVVSMFFVLLAFWLLMSGHYTPFLIGAGAVSCAFVVWVGRHKGVFQFRAGSKIHPLFTGAFTYWPWVTWQILVANVDVFKRVWHPKLPIDPQMVRIRYESDSELITTYYANSITLTPGTITVSVEDGVMEVHTLTKENAEALEGGEMYERVRRLEGGAAARPAGPLEIGGDA